MNRRDVDNLRELINLLGVEEDLSFDELLEVSAKQFAEYLNMKKGEKRLAKNGCYYTAEEDNGKDCEGCHFEHMKSCSRLTKYLGLGSCEYNNIIFKLERHEDVLEGNSGRRYVLVNKSDIEGLNVKTYQSDDEIRVLLVNGTIVPYCQNDYEFIRGEFSHVLFV
jgi:hypothetical protein